MSLEKTWRWFGPGDLITLDELRQIGVEGIVTSLHHIPKGEPWPVDEIVSAKQLIGDKGMRWSVVESLPVSEEIKYGGKERDKLIENYIESIRNLGACGIDTVCYNYMPVIDWIRTDLHYKFPDGTESLYFDLAKFVAFELFVLERKGAEEDYPEDVVKKARTIGESMSAEEREQLVDTIIVKTQGFIDGIKIEGETDPVEIFRKFLNLYENVDKPALRENLKYFLEQIIPEAEKADVRFAIHPDDPPMPVLGLPRIVSTADDIRWILNAVDSPSNGFTFCTGSLSVNPDNDLPGILKEFSDKVQFVHLRNTHLEANLNFYESGHISGRVDMYNIIKFLIGEQNLRKAHSRTDYRLPMRVDHGLRMLSDFNYDYNPGYPLIGRMKGFAELRGLEYGIIRMLEQA
jgi:mannonate dehydratase